MYFIFQTEDSVLETRGKETIIVIAHTIFQRSELREKHFLIYSMPRL